MTKRFYIEYDKNAYKCVCDNGKLICGVENLVDLLNNLYEENRDLRKLLNIGRTNAKDILDILNEQEKYKIKNQELKEENNQLYQKIFELRTELAYDRTKKEEHSDSIYDFQKKVEKW